MPDSVISPPTTQTKLPAIHGSNFGGHAPIEGAEIFIMQAGTNGYGYSGGAATNLCGTGTGSVTCVSDSNYGESYATTTAADGSFNVTGDYSCTAGYPVYLVAVGGYQTPSQGGSGYNSSPLMITGGSVTSTHHNGVYTNIVTLMANNLLNPGQEVNVAGLANATGNGNSNWTIANSADNTPQNSSWTITSATTTSFTYTVVSAEQITGSPTSSGATATINEPTAPNNPAIVNMAVLGNCPKSGVTNFGSGSSDALNYVYMNEVATAASAFALSAFGSGPFNIGIPAAATALELTNIENAANNAAQLYDIQGANVSGTFDGEGHIANAYTPGSYVNNVLSTTDYGIVDQKRLDTIGNILASCVDSENTYGLGSTGTGTTISANCQKLFENATSDGVHETGDKPGTATLPADIATAAFNIAHHPAGANAAGQGSTSFAAALITLQGTSGYPFSPTVTAADDFTIGIIYHATGINSPQSIAIDAAGDAFIASYFPTGTTGSNLVGLSPVGVPLANSPFAVPQARTAAVDASGNVWATGQNAFFYELPLTTAGTPGVPAVFGDVKTPFSFSGRLNGNTFAGGSSFGLAIDSSGNLNMTNFGSVGVYKFNTAGTLLAEYNACGADAIYLTLAPGTGGDIWTDSYYNNSGNVCNQSNAAVKESEVTGIASTAANAYGPNPFAVDGNGTAWVPVFEGNANASYLYKIPAGTNPTTAKITSGGLDRPAASAVDGSGNIWVANEGNQTVSEFTNAGLPITGTDAYRDADTVPGSAFDEANVAIDGSGDVWLAYNGSNSGNSTTAMEIIGAASPVVTPLVTATTGSNIGKRP